jgi:hypothetical protein
MPVTPNAPTDGIVWISQLRGAVRSLDTHLRHQQDARRLLDALAHVQRNDPVDLHTLADLASFDPRCDDASAMPTDLTVVLRDQPGELAKLGEVTSAAGVHLHGLAAFTGDGRGFVHALLADEDVEIAKQALAREGIGVADTREVLVVDVGTDGLVDVMLSLADANVNVDLAYTALGGSKVVIATDDVFNAREAVSR